MGLTLAMSYHLIVRGTVHVSLIVRGTVHVSLIVRGTVHLSLTWPRCHHLIVRTTVHLSLTWACYLSLTLRRGTGAGAASIARASPQPAQLPQQPPGVSLVRWWVVVAGLHLV